MVWNDPIVEEIHQIRADIMKAHNNDLHELFKDLRERQEKSERQVISRPPQRLKKKHHR